jgi:predicted ATPase
LTALVNAASLARQAPAVYVIEDAHWIDEVSESMLAEFVTVIPQRPSLVLASYRPDYRGALSRVAGAQTIALAPLSDPETAALVSGLLGEDPSVGGLATMIAGRAAGNPFFVEEMVRDLAERAVLRGSRGAYVAKADVGEVGVPATLQATIAAAIDRLDPAAKRTLGAAAVIGSRFGRGLLETLGIDPVLQDLVGGELIDQIRFTGQPEYVFRHPLIRTVAYESQLKSDRAELHRRVAAAIESRDPAAAEENAALIAEHLQAAGDLHAAYGWHMRAGAWATNRDIAAARLSWERARQIADALPADDPEATSSDASSVPQRSSSETNPTLVVCHQLGLARQSRRLRSVLYLAGRLSSICRGSTATEYLSTAAIRFQSTVIALDRLKCAGPR